MSQYCTVIWRLMNYCQFYYINISFKNTEITFIWIIIHQNKYCFVNLKNKTVLYLLV